MRRERRSGIRESVRRRNKYRGRPWGTAGGDALGENKGFQVFISCSKSFQISFTQFTRFLHVLWISYNHKQINIRCDAAYKIFFIILELISDYQLSSLFQIIIL